ncbi:MAG: hypothetical protein ABEJ85_03995 [Haloarculaceae archaeon]
MTAEIETPETDEEASDDDHLEEIEDGAGCTEIWERLSEQRASDDD